jgi:hypothetical protein
MNFNLPNFDNIVLTKESIQMKIGNSKSWIGEYFWVQLSEEKEISMTSVKRWCNKQFGKSNSIWYEHNKVFFFKNEKDRTAFILKWA